MNEPSLYLSVEEIQQQIIHMDKKKLRRFLHQYLPVKKIGKRLYVNRMALEQLLNDTDRSDFPLDKA